MQEEIAWPRHDAPSLAVRHGQERVVACELLRRAAGSNEDWPLQCVAEVLQSEVPCCSFMPLKNITTAGSGERCRERTACGDPSAGREAVEAVWEASGGLRQGAGRRGGAQTAFLFGRVKGGKLYPEIPGRV